jgi:hypothetical protein
MCKSSEFNAVYDEGTNMYVAVGQFAVTPDWQENAQNASTDDAGPAEGASLLVLLRRCWRVMITTRICP